MLFQIITITILLTVALFAFKPTRGFACALFLLTLTPNYLRRLARKCKSRKHADVFLHVADLKEKGKR